jgi:hypothetical protein
MQRFYVYDPAPTLRASKAPLLTIFGELDTPEGVKGCAVIRQILNQAGRRDYTFKVYPKRKSQPDGVSRDNPHKYVRLRRCQPGFLEMMVDWTTAQVGRRGPKR